MAGSGFMVFSDIVYGVDSGKEFLKSSHKRRRTFSNRAADRKRLLKVSQLFILLLFILYILRNLPNKFQALFDYNTIHHNSLRFDASQQYLVCTSRALVMIFQDKCFGLAKEISSF